MPALKLVALASIMVNPMGAHRPTAIAPQFVDTGQATNDSGGVHVQVNCNMLLLQIIFIARGAWQHQRDSGSLQTTRRLNNTLHRALQCGLSLLLDGPYYVRWRAMDAV